MGVAYAGVRAREATGPAADARQLSLHAGAEHDALAVPVRHRAAGARGGRAGVSPAFGAPRALSAAALARAALMSSLLGGPPRVVNIGLAGFARDLAANGAAVVQVDWRPPSRLSALLAALEARAPQIEQANAEALRRILGAEPWLTDVRRAGELIRELDAERLILHAGPPLGWARMCGPLRGAVCGAIVYEGWAADLAAAEAIAEGGGVRFAPNHHYGAVGPMTGITTRSQPLMVVENRSHGNRALCTINEGLGKVLRFGGNDAEVLARLAWLRDEFGPLLGRALESQPVPLSPLIARGLAMGDEMHQRNVACSSLLLRALA